MKARRWRRKRINDRRDEAGGLTINDKLDADFDPVDSVKAGDFDEREPDSLCWPG